MIASECSSEVIRITDPPMNTPLFTSWKMVVCWSTASAVKLPVAALQMICSPSCFRISSMGPIGSTMALMLMLMAFSFPAKSSGGGGDVGGRALGGVLDLLLLPVDSMFE